MTTQTIDLLPPRIRDRVRRSRIAQRACRTGFALVAVAVVAAAGAEMARIESLEHRDQLAAMSDAALKACEARDRLRSEVASLAQQLTGQERVDGRVPIATLVSALADAMPATTSIQRMSVADRGSVLEGEVHGEAEDLAGATAFAASLAATRPFASVTLDDSLGESGKRIFTVRFQVPLDRRYSLAHAPEVTDVP